MTPEQLHQEIRAAGLITLAVCQHVNDPAVALVYLHGSMGQWVDGYAIDVISQVPGVRSVVESVRTPAIILVQLEQTVPVPPPAPRPAF